jgi:AcrR family transcriptional regulator
LKPGKPRAAPLTKDRIAAVAIQFFAERGVDRTTMKDIAHAMGVTEPALYRHYASKEDLFARTFLDAYARIARGVAEAARGGKNLAEVTRALVAMFADLFDHERALFTFVLVDQHRGLPSVPLDPAVNVVSAIRDILSRAVAAREVRIDNVDMAAAAAIGIVVHTALFTHYGRLEGPLSNRVDAMSKAILAAVATFG